MGTGRDGIRLDRAGPVLCSLIVAAAVAWVAGWQWIVAPAALAVLGVAAYAVGADTRAPGDWRR